MAEGLKARRKAVLYAAAGIFLLVAAAALNRPVLALIGAVPILLVALHSGGKRMRAIGVSRQLDPDLRRFEGDSIPVEIVVEGSSLLTRVVELRDRLPDFMDLKEGSNYGVVGVRKGHPARLAYDAASPLFGIHPLGPLEARIEDPHGFFGTEKPLGLAESVKVEPNPSSLDATNVKSLIPRPFLGHYEVTQPGNGFEFFGLRDYDRADRMRDVNWKATSRVGRLVVNQHVKESQAQVVLLIDARATELAGAATVSPWAWTGRTAVEVAQELLQRRDALRIATYGKEIHEVRRTGPGRQFQALVDTIMETQPAGELGLGHALEEILPTLSPRSPVVIFSSLMADPTAEEGFLRLLSQDNQVLVFTAPPDWRGEPLTAVDQALRSERQRLVSSLRSYGCLVVDLADYQLAEVVAA